MKKHISRLGFILSLVYLALTTISVIYSRFCNQGICDVGYLLLPSLPWIGLFNGGSFGLVYYIISIILNIIIVYLIGYFIGLIIKKSKKNKRR